MTRRVRPGELPHFGQVWSWHENGPKMLALGVRPMVESRGIRLHLIGIQLLASPRSIDDTMRWSGPARVGMGPVLTDWFLHTDLYALPFFPSTAI